MSAKTLLMLPENAWLRSPWGDPVDGIPGSPGIESIPANQPWRDRISDALGSGVFSGLLLSAPSARPSSFRQHPMKHVLAIIAAATSVAGAEPVISTLEWRPACGGATIEITTDHAKVLSIHASAFHSAVIAEWSVHFVDGVPVSAEYRELDRGRILDGDHGGEYSGENTVKEITTWTWTGDHFPIKDDARRKELGEILAAAKSVAEHPSK